MHPIQVLWEKKWKTNVYSSTLKFVLFSWELCYLHCVFLYNSFLLSFSVTDFLYRNHYSSLTTFFVWVLIPLPFQYFWKYDCDYSTDDKTRQTSAQFFARKHFLFFTGWFLRCFAEGRRKRANEASVDCCSVIVAMRHENQLTSKFIQSLDGESPRWTAKFYWMHSFECCIQYNWQLEIEKFGNKALFAIENRSNSWIRRNFSNNWRHVINKPLLTETYALSVSLGGYMFKTDSRLRDGLNPSEFAVFNLLLDTKVK